MGAPKRYRKMHRLCALICVVPMLVITTSGVLLLLKKQLHWVQPSTMRGSGTVPSITMHEILQLARDVHDADVQSWEDIERVDIRPAKGLVKVRCVNSWEIQLDSRTGLVLQGAKRRSDVLEAIHDGSFFHPLAKLGLFLPNALAFLVLLATGVYLFILPMIVRGRRKSEGLPHGSSR